MIRFASSVIPVSELFPKLNKPKFVKVSQMSSGESMNVAGAVEQLASKLHEQWASEFRRNAQAKGDENPTRMKDDGMGGQVDILNTPFDQLPDKWKAENKAQAQAAIDLVVGAGGSASERIEELAAQVHEQWLSRNSWAKDGPLGVSYDQLPEEEKQKDRDVVMQAIDVLGMSESNVSQNMPDVDMEEDLTIPVDDF